MSDTTKAPDTKPIRYVATFELPAGEWGPDDVAIAFDVAMGGIYGNHPDVTVWTEQDFALDLADVTDDTGTTSRVVELEDALNSLLNALASDAAPDLLRAQ